MRCNNAEYYLLFEGNLNNTNVESMLDLLRTGVSERLNEIRITKLSRVLIEVLQNIVKHGARLEGQSSSIMLFKSDQGLFLRSSNIVTQEDKLVLQEKYRTLHEHDENAYKELYRSALTESEFNTRGGAGIGIYDIAYRTGKIPEYTFEETEQPDYFNYVLKINLGG
jgi:hypothetical protein